MADPRYPGYRAGGRFVSPSGRPLYGDEYLRRYAAQGRLYQVAGNGLATVGFGANIGMKDILGFAVTGMTGSWEKAMSGFLDAMKYRSSRRAGMERLHWEVAKLAQDRVVARYEQLRENSPISYRVNERYAGGKLGDALDSPDFFEARPTGILFINRRLLDTKARQWYRLNFGAGDRGLHGLQPREHPFVWPGKAGGHGTLGLTNFGASAPFKMPLGLFTRGYKDASSLRDKLNEFFDLADTAKQNKRTPRAFLGALNQTQVQTLRGGLEAILVPKGEIVQGATFFPYSQRSLGSSSKALQNLRPRVRRFLQAAVPTSGISAEGFFETGLTALATNLPPRYVDLFKQWLHDSLQENRGPAFKAGIVGSEAREYQAILNGIKYRRSGFGARFNR